MRLLVIGGTGLLGNKLVEQAHERFEVHATYHSSIVKRPNFHKLDVTNRKAVRTLIDELAPGAVVNTAAFQHIDKCETEMAAAKAVNFDAAVNVAEACADVGAHSVYLSTEYVFDGKKGSAYSEDDEPNPVNYYGETKQMAENTLLKGRGDALVVRTSFLYGWNDIKLNFATWAIGELEAERSVEVARDQIKSPTFADNLAEALLKCVELRRTGLYHMAGSDAIDVYNFTLMLAEIFNLDKNLVKAIDTSEMGQMAKRPLCAPLSFEKAEKDLGFRFCSAREGLGRMLSQRGDSERITAREKTRGASRFLL